MSGRAGSAGCGRIVQQSGLEPLRLFGWAGAEFVDALLDLFRVGRDAFRGFEVGNSFFGVAGLLFDQGEMPGDLEEEKSVGFFFGAFGLVPVFEGGFPEVTSMVGIVVVFVIDTAQFEKNRVAAGIGLESFAQEGFGFP